MSRNRWPLIALLALAAIGGVGCRPAGPMPNAAAEVTGTTASAAILPEEMSTIPERWESLISVHEPRMRASNALKTFDVDALKRKAIDQFAAGNPNGIYLCGYMLYSERAYRDAYTMYQLALKADPNFGRAHYGVGRLYYDLTLFDLLQRGQVRETDAGLPVPVADERGAECLEEALGEFEKAVALTPDIVRDSDIDRFREMCRVKLGDYYVRASHERIEEGRIDEGLVLCEKALQLPSPPYGASLNAAFCLVQLGRFDDAIKIFDESIGREPRRPEAYYGRVLARLRASGVDTDDKRRMDEGLRQEVRSSDLKSRIGAVLLLAGDSAPEVRRDVEQLLGSDRDLTEALGGLDLPVSPSKDAGVPKPAE